jgi:hypothetical protein
MGCSAASERRADALHCSSAAFATLTLWVYRSATPGSRVHAKPGGHPIGRICGFGSCFSLMGGFSMLALTVAVYSARAGGHLVDSITMLATFAGGSPSPCTQRPHSDSRGPEIATGSSRRHPVSCSVRQNGHPSRPKAITCVFYFRSRPCSYRRTLQCLRSESTSQTPFALAVFQVTVVGRFWVALRGGIGGR